MVGMNGLVIGDVFPTCRVRFVFLVKVDGDKALMVRELQKGTAISLG